VLAAKNGYFVIQLSGITAPRPLTFDEAKAELTATLKHEHAQEALNLKATEVRNKIEADMKTGKNFNEAAQAEGVSLPVARRLLAVLLRDKIPSVAQLGRFSRQAGLHVGGEHRETTLNRAEHAVSAVQASLTRRLSSGMSFLASIGSNGPFIGLFGTVYGIMDSFIGIANTNTTNLAVVAPGIAEALLATGLGLFAAIPSVIFYNVFQTRISAYGARTEGFVAELMNAISRQLDKGA